MLGKTNSSHTPWFSSVRRTASASFFEQIELMMPRRLSERMIATRDS